MGIKEMRHLAASLKGTSIQSQAAQVQIPGLLLASCATSDKLLQRSELVGSSVKGVSPILFSFVGESESQRQRVGWWLPAAEGKRVACLWARSFSWGRRTRSGDGWRRWLHSSENALTAQNLNVGIYIVYIYHNNRRTWGRLEGDHVC